METYVATKRIHLLPDNFSIETGDILHFDRSNNNKLTIFRNQQIIRSAKHSPLGISGMLRNGHIVAADGTEVIEESNPVTDPAAPVSSEPEETGDSSMITPVITESGTITLVEESPVDDSSDTTDTGTTDTGTTDDSSEGTGDVDQDAADVAAAEEGTPQPTIEKPLNKMTKVELVEFGAKLGLELDPASTRSELIAAAKVGLVGDRLPTDAEIETGKQIEASLDGTE